MYKKQTQNQYIMNNQFKLRILEALKSKRENFVGSDAKFATSLGINEAQYSQIKNGKIDKVLADEKWINIARQLQLNLKGQADWKTAETPVFSSVTAMLKKCQQDSISSILCDAADIGKSYSARVYARRNKAAIYIDCSHRKV
jgi:DNA-binding transcriptional regulator YdaS (Cro superfamily)